MNILLILVIFVPLCWGRLAEEVSTTNPCSNLHCYHKSRDFCPTLDQNCRCKVDTCSAAVICCDVDAFRLSEGLGCANVNLNTGDFALHIINSTLDVLNLTDNRWRRLTSMSITDGKIGSIVGEFHKHVSISCLNLSSNGITSIESRALVNLYNLSMLDLSHNNLSDVPRFKIDGMVTLDISDNTPMLCTNLYEALPRPYQFNNKNETWCLSSKTFDWFNSTELVQLAQVKRVYDLRRHCTKNCNCEPHRLDIVPGKPATFAVMVDCFGKHLSDLPTPLPPNTIYLNVSNNNITALDPVRKDPTYQSLRQLYADNNEINDLLPLEGTKFINNFVVLSMKNNKLKSLPTYVFSNIFDRNYNSRHVNLGHNRLFCDCNTAKVLKVWLLTKQKHIPDYDEIECENMDLKVINLDPSKLCQSQQDWTDYIYYIITAEVLLLVFLIAKVSYDYWVFKTAGYLPWPASKMPKLPCDWLCE